MPIALRAIGLLLIAPSVSRAVSYTARFLQETADVDLPRQYQPVFSVLEATEAGSRRRARAKVTTGRGGLAARRSFPC
jgi:hypothetical protein